MNTAIGSLKKISIPTGSGDVCAATLYRASGDTASAGACIVMGAGGTLTQMDGIPDYAQRLAAAGLNAFTFDYRHWGESEGEPRRLLSLRLQLEDWNAAIERARRLDGIDPERIAVWGMSSGGGNALMTAAADPRIAAVVALVPMADGLPFALRPARLRVALHAFRQRLRGRSAAFPAAGPPGSLAFFDEPEALPAFERVAAPNGWRNEARGDFSYPLFLYRPVRRAARIKAPVLVQLGELDGMAPRRAVEKTAARAPRGELRRYAIDHFGCFSSEHLDEVVGDQIDFLRASLASREE